MSLGQKIRETRLGRGLSLRKLAKLVEVSPSFISQVEQDKASPSIESLQKIGKILEVSSSFLLQEIESVEPVVIRQKSGKPKMISGVNLKPLAPSAKKNLLEPYLMVLQPGSTSQLIEDQKNNGEEFILLLSGSMELTLAGKKYLLKEGDNIYFNSTVSHQFKNGSGAPAKALWVSANQ
jgi:transcriptional regulator with XRE-family HTH domain